jgi:hypothetical protein
MPVDQVPDSCESIGGPSAAARILALALLFGATVQRMTTCCTVLANHFNGLAGSGSDSGDSLPDVVARRRPQQRPRTAAQATELNRANRAQRPLDVVVVGTISPRIAPLGCISRRNWAAVGYKCPFTGLLKATVEQCWLAYTVSQVAKAARILRHGYVARGSPRHRWALPPKSVPE